MLFRRIYSSILVKVALIVVTLLYIFMFLTKISINRKSFDYVKPYVASENERIDWHDYKFMLLEKLRSGPGENGNSVDLTDSVELEENQIGFQQEGFYTVVSDKISVNRSLPDARLDV